MATQKKNPPTSLKTARASKARKTQAAPPTEAASKRLSALDAAAKVLAETGQPMRCTELIAAMSAKGSWTSPAGQTPGQHVVRGFVTRAPHQERPGALSQDRARQVRCAGENRPGVKDESS